jgi:hypothetical protein
VEAGVLRKKIKCSGERGSRERRVAEDREKAEVEYACISS